MKTDKLEKFIIDHRDEFDHLEPSPDLWKKIETGKTKTVSLNWTNILVRAAAVVVIFVSSYIFIDYLTNKNQGPDLVIGQSENREAQGIIRELAEAEYYYTSQIEERKEVLYCLTENNTDLRNDIIEELIELDKVYKDLKEDLKDNADNEEVISAMIQNYRLKLDILNDILRQLRSAEKNKNCYDEETYHL